MFKTEVTMKNPPTSKHYRRLREAVAVCLNAAGIPTVAETIGSISLTLQGNWKPDHQWYELSDYKSRGSRSMICQLIMTQAPGGADIDNNEYVTVHGSDYHVDCSIKLQIPVKDAEYAVIVAAMQPAADDAEPTADAPVTTGIPVIDAELNGVRAGEQTVIAAPGKPYTPTQVVDMLRSILQKWTASQVEEFRTLVPDVMPLYSKARLQEAANEQGRNTGLVQAYHLDAANRSKYPQWPAWVTHAIAMCSWSGKVISELHFNTIAGKKCPKVNDWVVRDSLGNITVCSNRQFCEVYTPASCSQLDNYYSLQTIPITKVEEVATQPSEPTRIPLYGFQLTAYAASHYADWPKWVRKITVSVLNSEPGSPLLKVIDGKHALTVSADQWLIEYSDGSHDIMAPVMFDTFVKLHQLELLTFDTTPKQIDTRTAVEAFQLTPEALNAYSSWPQWVKADVITYTRTETDEVKVVMRTLSGRAVSIQPNDWVIRGRGDDAVSVGGVDYFNKHFTLKDASTLAVPVDAFQITPKTMSAYPKWPAWVINRLGTVTNRTNMDVRISLLVTPGKHRVTKPAGMSDWFIRYSDDVCCAVTHDEFQANYAALPLETTTQQYLYVDAVQLTREFTRDWLSWPSWLKNSTLNLDDSGDILLHPPVGENQTASFDDWIIHCEDGSLDVCRPGIFGKFYRVKPPTTEATK